jgi:hypothetical protein
MIPDDISIWSKEHKGRPALPPPPRPAPSHVEAPAPQAAEEWPPLPPGVVLPPGVTVEQFWQYQIEMHRQRELQQQQQQAQPQRPPGRLKIAALMGLQVVFGLGSMLIHGLRRLVGGILGFGGAVLGKIFKPSMNNGSKKKMSLKAVFLGAALLGGAMMAPGGYYMTQPNEIVRTRVTGKVEADTKAEFPGQKYFIYTNQGKFDTYGVENGKDITPGCVYDFNLKSARLTVWPPGYTRSIQSFKPVDGGCKP